MSLFATLFLAVAAPDPAVLTTLQALQAKDQRVAKIAFRLATRNVDQCKTRKPWPGFLIHEPGQYAPQIRASASSLFGFDGHAGILAVVPDGPASRAGLSAGDQLIAINGKPVLASDSRKADYAALAVIKGQLAAALAVGSVKLTTNQKMVQFKAMSGCPSDVEIIPRRKRLAHADGDIVQVSTSVVDEAHDDDELAFIIAHEMAHNILEHPQQLSQSKRSTARIRQTEIEADRLAVRLMHNAGYDSYAAARFWAHYGGGIGDGIFSDGTHMRGKERIAFLEQTARSVAPK